MANHFHVLVRVPATVVCTDGDLVARALAFYGSQSLYVQNLQAALRRQGHLPEDLRAGLLQRLGDVSVFMKELKQRFSKWFNRRHERFGTLWAERFKSLLVQDVPSVVEAVAAYVDLNPVRAGLVTDPKDYRWCGYAEAEAGNRGARSGLASCSKSKDWAEAARSYREVLLVKSGWAGSSGKVALSPAEIRKELKRGGELALGQALRLRVRYFSDGVLLGSRDFVNEVYEEFRDRFGPNRRTGARKLKGLGAMVGLATLRDLRSRAVG